MTFLDCDTLPQPNRMPRSREWPLSRYVKPQRIEWVNSLIVRLHSRARFHPLSLLITQSHGKRSSPVPSNVTRLRTALRARWRTPWVTKVVKTLLSQLLIIRGHPRDVSHFLIHMLRSKAHVGVLSAWVENLWLRLEDSASCHKSLGVIRLWKSTLVVDCCWKSKG